MKRTFLYGIIALLASVQIGTAQQELQRANTLFAKKYYVDAIGLYESVLTANKSKQVVQNLADCYYHTFDMASAAYWYTYLSDRYPDRVDDTHYFKLAQSLKAIGNYQEAEQVLKDYYNDLDNAEAILQLDAATIYLEDVAAMGKRFEIQNLPLNTSTSEFGAVPAGEQLFYTATKKAAIAKKYRWTNQHYLDIYSHPIAELEKDDKNSKSLSKNLNTKGHEGSFAVTNDGKTLYFTRNYSKGRSQTHTKHIANLKIYRSDFVDGKWEKAIELPFNHSNFSNAHPALDPTDNILYFSSDRPGGHGGFDLYKVVIGPDNSYGPPINLGPVVNTDKNEQFPFLSADTSLYFSSNGHPGFGLLDVFVSKNKKGAFQKPDNLGFPINGGYDDFSYVVTGDGKTGYFSSNRPTGKGSDDIYSFKEIKPLLIERCKQFIVGIITDRTTTEVLSNTTVELLDDQGQLIAAQVTQDDGAFNFTADCATNYVVRARKDGYVEGTRKITTDKKRKIKKDASIELYSIIEKEKAIVAEKARKKEAEQRLALQKAQEREKVKATRIEKIIKADNAIVKRENRTLIDTEEIRFDYNLWYLRKESRDRLSIVVQTMKDNLDMVIEVSTHTDIRGRRTYNQILSQKRADEVKAFLVKNGIAPDRVVAKGYGETRPILPCSPLEECNEEDHELNRRCEFEVVNWDYAAITPASK